MAVAVAVRLCKEQCRETLRERREGVRVERRTGRSNLSESRSRSVAIIIFAITTITYIRTDLRGPRGERGTSAEAARLSAGGHQSSDGPSFPPRRLIEPYFDFPLAPAASSSRFALRGLHIHHESRFGKKTKILTPDYLQLTPFCRYFSFVAASSSSFSKIVFLRC